MFNRTQFLPTSTENKPLSVSYSDQITYRIMIGSSPSKSTCRQTLDRALQEDIAKYITCLHMLFISMSVSLFALILASVTLFLFPHGGGSEDREAGSVFLTLVLVGKRSGNPLPSVETETLEVTILSPNAIDLLVFSQ